MSLLQNTFDAKALRPQLLACFPVFAELQVEELDALLAQATLVHAPQGTVLFDAKQPCRGFPLLLEGAIRVSKTTPAGREILLYQVDPGQACLLSGGCLLGHTDYTASAVAETDAVLLSLAV
jgi:CRP/FNR family transcriptional regulator